MPVRDLERLDDDSCACVGVSTVTFSPGVAQNLTRVLSVPPEPPTTKLRAGGER